MWKCGVWRAIYWDKTFRDVRKTKSEAYNTGYSQAVTHPSTNPARQGLTSVIGREPVLSLWYGRRRGNGVEIVLVIGQVQAVKRPHP